MKTKANVLAGFTLLLTLSLCSQAQNFNRTVSTNEVHHNSISDAWNFGVNTGASFGVKSNENTLFRGNSFATKLFGKYYFGNFGLGVSGGIIPGTISDNSVSKFFIDRKFPSDATVTKTKPGNSYLLFGPSVRFGKRVQFGADLNAGIFYNDAGGLSVNQQGLSRPLYRFDNGDKNLFPGFSGNLHLAYPINSSTNFLINTDYLQTKSSIRILDPQQGIDVATEQNRNVKLFTVGVGIVKSFGTTNETNRKRAGKAKYKNIVLKKLTDDETNYNEGSIRRILPTVNKRDIAIDEPGTLRVLPTVNKKDIAIDEPGTLRTMQSSCGPVTQKTTYPDGTVNEMTFACPEDAANYSRINNMPSRLSMTPTTARQTQGQTFGEKVASGLQSGAGALSQGASARNILIGKVSRVSGNVAGIETNETVSSTETIKRYRPGNIQNGTISARIYARDVSSGRPTGRRSREAGSGMATGRRQYQLVYSDDADSSFNDSEIAVVENPLYQSGGNSGTNPLYEGKDKRTTGTDDDCDGIAGLNVYLLDAESGEILAKTTTETCGNFFFANLPSGSYTVKIQGAVATKKGYDVSLKNKMDVAGQLLNGDERWSIELNTATGTAEQAAAVIKTKTKSNQSNDRTSNSNLVWSPRSNFKVLPVTNYDEDSDGMPDLILGNQLQPGYNSYPPVALIPGGPIKGVMVKAGKNPGGDVVVGARTNANGEFEFPNLQPGSYNFTIEGTTILDDVTFVIVGDEQNNSLSKTDAQDYNSTRSNKLLVNTKTGNDSTNTPTQKAQNNNTVRSNRTDNALDMNNDNDDNKKVTVRGWDPEKKESIQRNINTSKDNLKGMLISMNELEQKLNEDVNTPQIAVNTTRSNIKKLKTAIADVQETMDNIQQKDKNAAISELDQKTSTMSKQFAELQNSLSGLGNEYSSISNTLKARHDVAMNSIRNLK